MSQTYKTNDLKEYIELVNILLEESEMKLVEQFSDFYEAQFSGEQLDELIVVDIWQGLNDTHTLIIDMMNFYASLFDSETFTWVELQEYKENVTNAFNGFITNMIKSNENDNYYYKEYEKPRLQGVNFGIRIISTEIIPNIEKSLLP